MNQNHHWQLQHHSISFPYRKVPQQNADGTVAAHVSQDLRKTQTKQKTQTKTTATKTPPPKKPQNLNRLFFHSNKHTYPCGLRSKESSRLCCKLGEPKSAAALLAAVAVPVLIVVVVASVPDPFVHTFGGLVSKASDSAKFFTWCITPLQKKKSLLGGLVWLWRVFCGGWQGQTCLKRLKSVTWNSVLTMAALAHPTNQC